MHIVEMGPMTVVGIPVRARWEELWVKMPQVWREFRARYTEIEHRYSDGLIDVSLDQNADEYLQLVCARVTKGSQVPKGMRMIEIPSQRFVHHRHVGPVKEIAEGFGKMYQWAIEEGHPAGEFKIDIGYTVNGNEIEHDLYVGMLPSKPWREVAAI